MNEALAIVDITHEQYRQAIDELERKRNSFLQSMVFAREQGASYASIGKVTGMSRQRVFTLIGNQQTKGA